MKAWLSFRTAGELASRTRLAWRDLRSGSLKRLLLADAMAFAVAVSLTAGITLAARALARGGEGGAGGAGGFDLAAWDRSVLLGIHDGRGLAAWLPGKFTDGIVLESPANLFILLPLTLLSAAVALWHRRLLWAVQFVLAYALARLLIWTGWWLWDRSRPDVIADGAAALAAHSFPSGHAVLPFTTYGLLAFAWACASRSKAERVVAFTLLVIFAGLIGYSRLLLGAHWPSDVLAGLLIGAVWLAGSATALGYAQRHSAS
ncbi:MAG: phosphatase PAP2 family protein [Phycisphaerae bacterium]